MAVKERLILYLIALLFLILALPNLNYPGLSIDEAGDGIVSGYIFKNLPAESKNLSSIIGADRVVLFNKLIPIMTGEYHASVNSYIILPFLRFFGFNVFALRLASLLIALFSVFLIYFVCKIWFSRRIAWVVSLLSASNLGFVQYSRVGLFREEIFIIFFFWITIFLFLKYFEQKKLGFVYAGFYCLGLGVSNKVTFLWYAAGLLLAYFSLRRKLGLSLLLSLKQKLICLTGFCLGSVFLIIYNVRQPGISFRILLQSLFFYPVIKNNTQISNLHYWENLKIRISHLIMFLKENITERCDWGVQQAGWLEHWSFMIMLLSVITFSGTLICVLLSKNHQQKYRILFFYVVFITVFALTPFTVSGFDPGHLLVLFPFTQIVLALFLDYIWQSAGQHKKFIAAVYPVFLIPVLTFHILMNIHFHQAMRENGGYRRWSTAIYELADYLDKNKIQPVTFGWGLKENLAFLTDQRVVPIQFDEFNFSQAALIKEYDRLAVKKEPFFYLTMMAEENTSFLELFMNLAAEDGKNKVLEKIFFNQAGDQVYWLYKIY